MSNLHLPGSLTWSQVGRLFLPSSNIWFPPAGDLPPGNHYSKQGWIHVLPTDVEPCMSIVLDVNHDGKTHRRFRESDPLFIVSRDKPGLSQRRRIQIILSFDRRIKIDRCVVPYNGSPIQIRTRAEGTVLPAEAIVKNLYTRKSGGGREKVINQLTLVNAAPSTEIHCTLRRRFKSVYSADTNSKMIGQARICITSICEGVIRPLDPDWSVLECSHRSTIVFPKGQLDPEATGWLRAIWSIERDHPPPPKPCVLVVDAHLGKLDDFNQRKLPLVPGEFLPGGWSLMYASADAGTREFLPNGMIAASNTASNLAFEEIKQAGLPPQWPSAEL